jgi:N-acetylglucosamine kinase-like BadF-type ATPase
MNPNFVSPQQLEAVFAGLLAELPVAEIRAVYFYGSGCGTATHRDRVRDCLQARVPDAAITVATDLDGAAIALFGKERGVACILGTGANAGVYDGARIVRAPRSLGYILGDSGSGAVLGLALLQLYLRHKLPAATARQLEEEHQVGYAYLLDRVYHRERPNCFFASFAPFVHRHADCPVIREMLAEQFEEFVRYFLLPFPEALAAPVRVAGSVGYHFRALLTETARRYGLDIDRAVPRPIELLVSHFTREATL